MKTKNKIIDGKAYAAGLRNDIAQQVQHLRQEYQLTAGLAVVLVGDDPASHVYVANKAKACKEAGIFSEEIRLPADSSEVSLLEVIARLNHAPEIHGILVQLPLPRHLHESTIIAAIDPRKDVDGLHVVNTGKLASGHRDAMVPCTPLGTMMLLNNHFNDALTGLHAVVIGRSNLVGKPVAQLLLQANCTVTMAHSKTRDLPALCRMADIIVAAVGVPELVKADWIREGAVVMDVGINRVDAGNGKTRLVGDVAFEEVAAKAAAITPVPGGIGPMTIACLLYNTLRAAREQNGIPA